MTITVNGKNQEVEGPIPLGRLLHELGVDPLTVAVEHNRQIVGRDRFGEVLLQDGDTLEIIRLVGGG